MSEPPRIIFTQETTTITIPIQEPPEDVEEEVTLGDVSEEDARTLTSVEHQAIDYRPPPGSLAARAQSAASRRPGTAADVAPETLRATVLDDAERVAADEQTRGPPVTVVHGIDINHIGEDEARHLVFVEHRTLGYVPPHESLASGAQHAASDHPGSVSMPDTSKLTEAAVDDAVDFEVRRVRSSLGKSSGSGDIDVDAAEEIFSGH